jgi:hypothetical protein
MLKNLIVVFALFSLCTPVVYSQNLNTDWGSSIELENTFRDVVYVDSTGASFYLTSTKSGDYFIEKQKAGENKASSVVKVIASERGAPEYKRLLISKTGIAVVSTVADKKASTLKYYYNVVTFDGKLQFTEEKEFLIINIDKKVWPGSSMVIISPNKTQIAVSFRGTETQTFQWYGFDSDFKPTFTKESGMYKNSKYGLVAADNFSVSDNGDIVYYCEKLTVRKKNKWEGSEMWLFALPANSKSVDSVAIKPSAKNFTAFTIQPDGNNIIIFGLYTDRYAAAGTYFASYSIADKKLSVETNTAFEISQFITPGATGASKEIPAIGRGGLSLIKNSTGYYAILDPVFAQASQAPGGGSTLMYTLYTMHIFSMSSSGDINWISTIFRDQICKEMSGAFGIGGALSVTTSVMLRQDDVSLFGSACTLVGDNLVFVMNDAPANAPQPADATKIDAVRKTKELTAQVVTISSDGKVDKKVVKNNNGAVTRWHVAYSYVSSANIYTIAEDGESTRLVRVY